MIRRLLTVLAAAASLGAARGPAPVEYRLGVEPAAPGAPPELAVEMRLRGDADGETRLELPDTFANGRDYWRNLSGLTVKGATVSEDGPAVRVLRHKPAAAITVSYRVRTAYPEDPRAGSGGNPYAGALIRPTWFAVLGETVFAAPAGRYGEPATFRWGRLPAGWQVVSDLEHGIMGRALRVGDIGDSISMGGAGLVVETRTVAGGPLRVAMPAATPLPKDQVAEAMSAIVAAQRAFFSDGAEPYLVAAIPLAAAEKGHSLGGTGRGDAFTLYADPKTTVEELRSVIAHEHVHSWIPRRTGRMPEGAQEPASYWFSEGFTDFYTARTMARGGLWTADQALAYLQRELAAYDASAVRTAPNARIVTGFWSGGRALHDLPYQRGMLLALKWDEEIRRKTKGAKDLDDVVLRMRDRYLSYTTRPGPDVPTGLVSAFWDEAQMDVRADLARFVDDGAAIELPDELFGGCVQVRTTLAPDYDAGFDAEASFAAKVVKGVRRNGPAWNSGVRNGMPLVGWSIWPGDTSRQVSLTVQPPPDGKRGRAPAPRKIVYWPYGDGVVKTRKLQLAPGADPAACGRRIGGL